MQKDRTLWVVTVRSDLQGHTAYRELFTACKPLELSSEVQKDDVLFFDGGTDLNSKLYGEQRHDAAGYPDISRDTRETWAFKKGRDAGASLLGTCRGAQLLCVLSGGKLVQHVTGHNGGHMIFNTLGDTMYSESSHHQVMWPYNINHDLIAWADPKAQQPFVVSDEYGKKFVDDLTPEIIYCQDTQALCIQGHSEWVEEDSDFRKFTHRLVKEYLLNR